MFENLSGGQFLRITDSPLVRVPDVSINGASADYDNDGDLDVCVTSWNSTNQLYRNVGNGVFELDPASPPFPSGQRRNVASWGDYDNDGWLDERERKDGVRASSFSFLACGGGLSRRARRSRPTIVRVIPVRVLTRDLTPACAQGPDRSFSGRAETPHRFHGDTRPGLRQPPGSSRLPGIRGCRRGDPARSSQRP